MINRKGRSFVGITITIAVSALLLRVAIERIISLTIVQNESSAQATLKAIAVALDNYAKENVGIFPAELSVLTKTQPAYIDTDYVQRSPVKGYKYTFTKLDPYSYSCRAMPVQCNLTGNRDFTITTGGLLVSQECGKKE